MLKYLLFLAAAVTPASCSPSYPLARAVNNLTVQISVADGLLNGPIDGRIVILFAPNGTDPLDDTDVTSSRDKIFGKNVFNFGKKDTATLRAGSNDGTATGVFGWPIVSMNDVAVGSYSVQAFLTPYEKVTRGDGSVVSVHFPCGDGAPNIDGVGSLYTAVANVVVLGGVQTTSLQFTNITATSPLAGKEIGGCSQGNYVDTANLKYIKIRSKKLSNFWNRDMYVGATVLLPAGYNAADTSRRYPVIYSQGHWAGSRGGFGYPTAAYSAAWNAGFITAANGTTRPTPKLIIIRFRHETPLYDDSYAVNSANLGPYGDAINDELIPYLEKMFNTIQAPYARIQEGGSTGGWESIANLIFRPDLFGACFSSYPDSLDFHRHQDIQLYDSANAYTRADGSQVPSIRTFVNNTEKILATVAQENHWELTYGTSTRSNLQWDIWFTVFGVQGLNGYPLTAWDKVTGEIYPGAVEYWKTMDLAQVILTNWNNSRNLGASLAGRVYIYVGTHDDYYLNEGVLEFQKRTDAIGGAGWANVTILAGQPHGGNYQRREIWNYLEFLDAWIKDHGPNGTKTIPASATSPNTRGNLWEDVKKQGGHQAALARQAAPKIEGKDRVKMGATVTASVGRWDPGVVLQAQWAVNGRASGKAFAVGQGETVTYTAATSGTSYQLQLWVTGSKRDYDTEARMSGVIAVVPK